MGGQPESPLLTEARCEHGEPDMTRPYDQNIDGLRQRHIDLLFPDFLLAVPPHFQDNASARGSGGSPASCEACNSEPAKFPFYAPLIGPCCLVEHSRIYLIVFC